MSFKWNDNLLLSNEIKKILAVFLSNHPNYMHLTMKNNPYNNRAFQIGYASSSYFNRISKHPFILNDAALKLLLHYKAETSNLVQI